jgi:hypothetical protein
MSPWLNGWSGDILLVTERLVLRDRLWIDQMLKSSGFLITLTHKGPYQYKRVGINPTLF